MDVGADIIEKLPLKKNPTTKEILYLLIGMGCLVWFGFLVKGWIDGYERKIDINHTAVMAAIAASDTLHAATLQAAQVSISAITDAHRLQIDANSREIDTLKRYGVTRSDFIDWTIRLERGNRDLGHVTPGAQAGLFMPDVPDHRNPSPSKTN